MDSLVITWRELLIVVAVVLAVYVAEMLLLLRSKSKRGRRSGKADDEVFPVPPMSADRPRLDALENEVKQLREQLLNVREQLERIKATPPPQPASAQTSSLYTRAIMLAQQGADVSEVAENCGISRGEAELIVAMHRSKGA